MNTEIQQAVALEFASVDAYTILAAASETALTGDIRKAHALLRLARNMATAEQAANIGWLSGSVMMDIAWVAKLQREPRPHVHNEFGVVHYWFRQNFKRFIPDGELVKFTAVRGSLPDFMIQIGDEQRPVECKLKFNARALNQLDSYLKAYGASAGYAVGTELCCKVPDHITFILCPSEAKHD